MAKNKTTFIIFFVIFGVVFGLIVLQRYLNSGPDIIARAGIHWHPHLAIRIRGEEVAIPAGIGLDGAHLPVHTHDPDGIIHLEFSGTVREGDIQLKRFFEIWGKSFSRECVLDACASEGGAVKMFVNGTPSEEYGEYIMRDGDQIEIIYDLP